MSDEVLRCRNLDVAIGDLRLVSDLDLDINAGDFVAVLGCNGAGKSTLIQTLAGLYAPAGGTIDLMGTTLHAQSRIEIARHVAMLAQRHDDAFPSTVLETVLLGRHPHLGFWEWESARDHGIATAALSSLDLDGFASRYTATLSGGERQRTALAAVLAQQTALNLLDEPLNNLDPYHQLSVLKLFRDLSAQGQATIAILHDLNLVSRFADKALLLYGPQHDGAWLYGNLDNCMTPANLSRLYDTSIERLNHDGQTLFVAR